MCDVNFEDGRGHVDFAALCDSDLELAVASAVPVYGGSRAWFTCRAPFYLATNWVESLPADFAVASKCKRETQRYIVGASTLGFPGFPAGLWDHGMKCLHL